MGKKWTDEEITFLKFAYPNKDFTVKEICIALDRGDSSISNKASSLGIYRPKEDELPSGYKKCSKCDVIAPLNEFYKSKKTKDGYDGCCKYCKSKKILKRGISENTIECNSNTKRGISENITKTCKECGEEKSVCEFYRNKKMKDGYFNTCKLCESYKARKRYIKGGY